MSKRIYTFACPIKNENSFLARNSFIAGNSFLARNSFLAGNSFLKRWDNFLKREQLLF
jgi:hypothetical protein